MSFRNEPGYAEFARKLIDKTKREAKPETKPYVTITWGISGHFAVMVWLNPDMGGFWEPLESGKGRYATKEEAIAEGREWAKTEELEFKMPKESA